MRSLRTLLASTPLLLLAAALVAAAPTDNYEDGADAGAYDPSAQLSGSQADVEEDAPGKNVYATMPIPEGVPTNPPDTTPVVPPQNPAPVQQPNPGAGEEGKYNGGNGDTGGNKGDPAPSPGPVTDPGNGGAKRTVTAYWTDWTSQDMPPEKIPYTKVTHINYAFATLEQDFSLKIGNEQFVPQVIKPAHENNVKVILAVGGWSGSAWFSPMVATPESRATFIANCKTTMNTHKFDGIDLDWEFPGEQGAPGNKFSPTTDVPGLVELVVEMRAEFTKTYGAGAKEITLAGSLYPFNVEVNGKKGWMTNARRMADAVDRINLMTYEMAGPWSPTTGPNAALRYDTRSGLPKLSVEDSVAAWRSRGVPANKLTVGLAYFGRSAKATEDMTKPPRQYVKFDKVMPQGDKSDTGAEKNGIWQWANLRSQGVLLTPVKAAADWAHYWDPVTQTPWLYNTKTSVFISYDDPRSIGIKANYARCKGLNGVMIWSVSQDKDDELVDATTRAVHGTGVC